MRLCLVLLCGCGRIAFDSLGDSGSASPDATPCIPAASESCNARDDTCDGLVDEGCPCTEFDTNIGTTPLMAHPPIAWNGVMLASLTTQGSQLYLVRTDGAGTPIGTMTSLAPYRQIPRHVLVATPSGYAAAVQDSSGGLSVLRLSPTGAIQGVTPIVTHAPVSAELLAGSELAIIWTDARTSIPQTYFRRLALDGNLLGTEVALDDSHGPVQRFEAEAIPGGYMLFGIDSHMPGFHAQLRVLDSEGNVRMVGSIPIPGNEEPSLVVTDRGPILLLDTDLYEVESDLTPKAPVTTTMVSGHDLDWTGTTLVIAAFPYVSSRKQVVLADLQRDGTFANTEVIFDMAATSSMTGFPATYADAVRTIATYVISVNGGPVIRYINQRCH